MTDTENDNTRHRRLTAAPAVVALFCALPLFCGCQLLGLPAAVVTPTGFESEVPAEFDLAKHKTATILVLVDQPGYLSAEINFRPYLTDAVNALLQLKVKIPAKRLVAYDRLSGFRSTRADFHSLSTTEIGKELGADFILLVSIADYELYPLPSTRYYSGSLDAGAALFDCAADKRVWPADSEMKNVRVGFEFERGGREAAVKRLTAAAANCITRYLYNCSRRGFIVSDDIMRRRPEQWR